MYLGFLLALASLEQWGGWATRNPDLARGGLLGIPLFAGSPLALVEGLGA